MNVASHFMYVGLGGALGACLRYAFSLWLAGQSFRLPLATLAANVLGALLAGLVVTWFWERGQFGTPVQLLLVVGFLGGFTTFSTFSVETLRLMETGSLVPALMNMALNLFGSLLAVALGSRLMRCLMGV